MKFKKNDIKVLITASILGLFVVLLFSMFNRSRFHFIGFTYNNRQIPAYQASNAEICPTKKTCSDMKNKCKCWCSHKCGPRDKEDDDSPVYVNDDKYGNYCYCKQWDLDNVGRCPVKPRK